MTRPAPERTRGERIADAVANAALAVFLLTCAVTGVLVAGDLFGAVTLTDREVDTVGLAFMAAAVGVVGFLLRWAFERPADAPRRR